MEFIDATVKIPKQPYLTAAEVCDIFRVEERTLRRWVAAGKFPPAGPGRTWSNWAVFAAILWREVGPRQADGDGRPEPARSAEPAEEGGDDALAARGRVKKV
jgi:hypothetical protein